MRRKVSIVLLLALCLSLFAGCSIVPKNPEPSQGLQDAKVYLDSYMKKNVPATTTVGFDVLGVVAVGGVIYQVEWTTNNEAITLTRDDDNGLVKVSVPPCGDVAVSYTLTATLSEESGATVTSAFNFTVPVADYVIAAPQVGVAYKLGIFSTAKSAAYYFVGKMKEYYGDTSTAFSKGADVYVEVVDGGYHLYFNDADGAKKYISVVPSGTHRNFVFNAETPSVFVFDAQYSTFYTMVDVDGAQEKCYMGTSANYYTMGAFNDTKIAADTYFAHLYVNDANNGSGETPDDPNTPSVADPTPDTQLSILDAFNLGKTKDSNEYTEGKYYIVGEIKEVYQTTYGNMYVKDENGNELTIYGTYSGDGETRYDAMTTKPVAGDTVKLYGIIGQYNGTPQMKNAWIVEINGVTTICEHTGGTATCTAKAICSACGKAYGDIADHNYVNGACSSCGVAEPTTSTAPFADGDKVVIVCGAYNKALSSVATGYYLSGVDVTVTDGTVTGYGDTEVWTVIANADGSYSFAYNGQNLGMQDSHNSMSLGSVNDDWKLVPQADGTYALQNTVRGTYIEWYAEKNNWSTYTPDALTDLFFLSFYVVG